MIVPRERLGIFLAQYMGQPGCDDLWSAAKVMADIGYTQLQLPPDVIDLALAATDVGYCGDLKRELAKIGDPGLGVSELSYHIPGQLMAVHPAYLELFAGFLPESMRNGADQKTMFEWGDHTTRQIIDASANLGLKTAVGFTGSFLWPYVYPWPQRSAGLVQMAFKELAARWKPILEYADEKNVNLAFELHPGEDTHDGHSFNLFLRALREAGISESALKRAGINFDPSHMMLMGIPAEDIIQFVVKWIAGIFAYHAKDGEFVPFMDQGVYGGFAGWNDRAGKFRTPGTGMVNFAAIQAILDAAGVIIPVIVEWEDPGQDALQGARWAYQFLTTGTIPEEDIIPPAKAFDDFAASGADTRQLLHLLGLVKFSLAA